MTKTERLHAALLADGYVPCETRSSRPCFTKMRPKRDGTAAPHHYVWLLTGCLRGAWTNKYGDAVALPNMEKRLLVLQAGRLELKS